MMNPIHTACIKTETKPTLVALHKTPKIELGVPIDTPSLTYYYHSTLEEVELSSEESEVTPK
jgi:hypothetical protein